MFHFPNKSIGGKWTFSWGPVIHVHEVQGLKLDIVEFQPEIFVNSIGSGEYSENESDHLFHLYVDEQDKNRSYPNLSAAIIAGIGFNKDREGMEDMVRAACKLMECAD